MEKNEVRNSIRVCEIFKTQTVVIPAAQMRQNQRKKKCFFLSFFISFVYAAFSNRKNWLNNAIK